MTPSALFFGVFIVVFIPHDADQIDAALLSLSEYDAVRRLHEEHLSADFYVVFGAIGEEHALFDFRFISDRFIQIDRIRARRFNLQRARSSLHSLQRVQGICATCGEREVPLTAYSERGVPRAAYNEREAFFKFKP